MEKTYLISSQPIPEKGMSYNWYEIEGEDTILRMLVSIPSDGTIKLYAKPPVKKLFAPQRCEKGNKAEFISLWDQGEKKNGAQGQD